METALLTLSNLEATAPSQSARLWLERPREIGAWLTVMLETLNNTKLTKEEFRGSLQLRFSLRPSHLAPTCNRCGAAFSVEHSLSCRCGGHVMLCHSNVQREWHHLCAQATTQPAVLVSDRPLIHTGQAAALTGDARGTNPNPDTRGNIAVHGF
jgi:hypothetical protein